MSAPRKRVNKIRNIAHVRPSSIGQHPYRVVVTNATTGEVLYDWTSKALLLASCEEGKVDEGTGEIEGRHQFVGCGHPMLMWFLLDQMNKAFMAKQGLWAKVWEMFEQERSKLMRRVFGDIDQGPDNGPEPEKV